MLIHANLTSEADTTTARILQENYGLSFMGTTKIGAFDISPDVAAKMLAAPVNPNGLPNSNVVRPWVNAMDLTRRPRGMSIIGFGAKMPETEAALYELSFEYLRQNVHAKRSENNREGYRTKWWLHGEPRPDMREALTGLKRFIITPRVSKYRLFAGYLRKRLPTQLHSCSPARTIISSECCIRACTKHGHAHREPNSAKWSGFRYTPTSTFETFPFPWPPGHEPQDSPLVQAIAEAARELVEKRDAWLNPPNATEEELKKRTLTNLYNARPSWLAEAHRNLDEAVFAAYGWPSSLTDAELLERLLALNHERAALHG